MLTVDYMCHRLRSEGTGLHFGVELNFFVKVCAVQGSLHIMQYLIETASNGR